jgi:hypothetical protein
MCGYTKTGKKITEDMKTGEAIGPNHQQRVTDTMRGIGIIQEEGIGGTKAAGINTKVVETGTKVVETGMIMAGIGRVQIVS